MDVKHVNLWVFCLIIHKRVQRRNKPANMLEHFWTRTSGLFCFSVISRCSGNLNTVTPSPPNSNGMHNKEVLKPFVELWWKLSVPRGWIFSLSHGLWWGESRVCSLDSKPRHLIQAPELLPKHSVDTGFRSHEGWSVLTGTCAVITAPTRSPRLRTH